MQDSDSNIKINITYSNIIDTNSKIRLQEYL